MRKTLFLWVLLFLGILTLVISGETDLDWMVNLYYWGHLSVNGANGIWKFSTFWTMEWWLAYQFSLWRVKLGWFLVGLLAAYILNKAEETGRIVNAHER